MQAEKHPDPSTQTGYERLIQQERLFEDEDQAWTQQNLYPSSQHPARFDTRERWHYSTVLSLLGKAFVVLLAVWAAGSLFWSAYKSLYSVDTVDCNCGKSMAAAIAKGCKFDEMATSWLPPACRDDELLDEFSRAGPGSNGEWGYYADRDGNVTHTVEDLSMLAEKGTNDEREYWATQEWHMAHCVFYWRKVSRSRLYGKPDIEKSFSGESHAKHCKEVFWSAAPLDYISAQNHVGLNSDIEGDGS